MLNERMKKIVKALSNSSEVIGDNVKISTDEIIENGGNITITMVDIINGEDGDYAVMNMKEYPDKYYNGGKQLTDLVKMLVEEFGTIDDVNTELEKTPLALHIEVVKTKKKNDFVVVSLVD